MLKKIPPFMLAVAAALTLALAPAQDAAAWSRICMKLPLWEALFPGAMHVVFGFEPRPGKTPTRFYRGGRTQNLPDSLGGDSSMPPARGRMETKLLGAHETSSCIRLSGRGIKGSRINPDEPFFVYLQVHQGKAVRCKTHPSNPNPWYRQQKRPYRAIWFKAWGIPEHPQCEFTHER